MQELRGLCADGVSSRDCVGECIDERINAQPVVRSLPSSDSSDFDDDLDLSDSDEEDITFIDPGAGPRPRISVDEIDAVREIYLSDSSDGGGLVDLEEHENNEENTTLEEALGLVEVELFGQMGPGRRGYHIDRIECLETICGVVVLDAQNDQLMERLRTIVNILGDDEGPYADVYIDEETEDNTEEKTMAVKKTVQEMGELLFDIKDKITEGEYLKLMDGLQSITNEMNQ